MSPHDSITFKDFIPNELYKRYFDVIKNNGTVYVCLIQNEAQMNVVYLEPSSRKNDRIEGILRVFFEQEQVKRYNKQVAIAEGVSPDLIRRLEMKFSELIEYISSLDARYKKAGRKGIRAVASSIHSEKMVVLDIVWTSEKDLMV